MNDAFDLCRGLHGYADDWWAIYSGEQPSPVGMSVASAVNPLITDWAPRNGQRFNVGKSCVSVFSKHFVDPSQVVVRLGNVTLRFEATPKCLGIT